jgi:hypothetical protein
VPIDRDVRYGEHVTARALPTHEIAAMLRDARAHTFALYGDLTDAQLERLARVARACPLRRSIEAGIEFAETVSLRPREPNRELVEAGGAS